MSLSNTRYCRHIKAEIKDSGEYEVIVITRNKHLKVEVKSLVDGERFFAYFPSSPRNKSAAEKGVMKTVKKSHRAKCTGCRL